MDTALPTACWGFEPLADGSNRTYDSTRFGDGIELHFRAEDSSFTVVGAQFRYTFLPAFKETRDGADVYRSSVGAGTIAELTIHASDTEYSRAFTLSRTDGTLGTGLRCITGIATAADDLPADRPTYANLAIEGAIALGLHEYDASASQGSLSLQSEEPMVDWLMVLAGASRTANPGTDTVYQLVTLAPLDPAPAVEGRFEGLVHGPDETNVAGTFGGAFFGPAGTEVAGLVAFDGRLRDRRLIDGTVWFLGRRTP